MRVFVTGAAGYIGEAVAIAFRRQGHQVKGLVRKEADTIRLKRNEIEPVLASLSDPETYLKEISCCQVLVHCAFENSPQGITLDEMAIDTFLQSARSTELPRTVIYTSGCWVYGSNKNDWVDESSPLHPLSLVAWRPRHEEKVLKCGFSWVRPVVIRPGCVYGGRGGLTGFWFDSIARGSPILPGDGSQVWSMVHIDDLAELYVKAAEQELGPVIFNASDQSAYTIKECMEAVLLSQNLSTPILHLSKEESGKKWGRLSEGLLAEQKILSGRAYRLLDWTPKHLPFPADAKKYYEAWSASRP